MSLTGYRDEIAAALSTAEGVTGYAYRPTVTEPGDAWVLLTSLERDAGLAFMVTWRVFVLLPQDEEQASVWLDAHHEALVDALEPVGFVDRIQPFNLGSDSQPVYGLQITMRSE